MRISLYRFAELLISYFIYTLFKTSQRSWGSSVSIVSDYGLDDQAIRVRSPAEAEDFSSPPVQWVPGVLSPGQSVAGA
jgi:hypothetical protein